MLYFSEQLQKHLPTKVIRSIHSRSGVPRFSSASKVGQKPWGPDSRHIGSNICHIIPAINEFWTLSYICHRISSYFIPVFMILRGLKGDINITYILIHYGATLIGASLVKTTVWPSSKTKTTQVQSWFHFAFLAIVLPSSVDVFSLHCFALENAMFPWHAQKRYYDLSIKKFVLEARPSLLA